MTDSQPPVSTDGEPPIILPYRTGDVFQITEAHGRRGWVGAFVLATEIRSWGIQGFVVHVETHDEQRHAFIRLPWDHLVYVGHAASVPLEAPTDPVDGSRQPPGRPSHEVVNGAEPDGQRTLFDVGEPVEPKPKKRLGRGKAKGAEGSTKGS